MESMRERMRAERTGICKDEVYGQVKEDSSAMVTQLRKFSGTKGQIRLHYAKLDLHP